MRYPGPRHGRGGYTPQQMIGQAKIETIKGWCNDMEALAITELRAGAPVGDYKLVQGRSNRAWRDEEAAAKSMTGSYKMKVREIYERKLISPRAFEKLKGKKRPVLQKHVTKPQGQPMLAPGGDKRPPFTVDPKKEFEGMEE